MSRSFIAKLTKPDLAHTFPRPRLADELERLAQRHSILWVSAPAGSGKTTLAASYLEARQGRHLWYQVDIRDAEAATFFYYLREAALHLAPEQEHSLPLLTPEYQLGLEA